MSYRKEIDGLRALAVISVILYHAGFKAFSGGFVGVDIFFVISGYLIARIIFLELESKKFSIFTFYERRTRRILPALFVVMLACLPFAWFWLLPKDMKEFSQSLVAINFWSSNFLFLQQIGYFEPAAELKPLLHTWSLALEEQYYLFFSIFALFTWKYGKKCIITLLVLIYLISIIFAQWGSITHPMSAFYLLPSRIWEFINGVLVALYLSHKTSFPPSKFASETGSILGLIILIYSIFLFDKTTPSPSFYTLLPTTGAALIITFSNNNTFIGKILGSKIPSKIGLISYSAYLWHQPIFAFVNHRGILEPGQIIYYALITLTFTLAFFSWRFIEIPFRNTNTITRKNFSSSHSY